jgi:pyrimidine operon attenuation protein/uracil phosphoribosyltransferase
MELKPILNRTQLAQKIKRIAYEIYERNYTETELVLVGIKDEGFVFAQMLKVHLEKISPINITLAALTLDKSAKTHPAVFLDSPVDVAGKVVIVADDVLNTGRTLFFAVSHFLKYPVKKVQTAIIVNRTHRHFPISADYMGYELGTTFKDHVVVKLSDEASFGAYMH